MWKGLGPVRAWEAGSAQLPECSGATHVVDSEETQRHHVGAPLGPRPAGAATGSDAAAVEHDGHVVGALGLSGLGGHHGGAEVKTCRRGRK